MSVQPLPRATLPAFLAMLVAGCPQPSNPLGPPITPPPAPPAAPVAYRFGAVGQDRGQAVAADVSGGIHVAGAFTGTVDFDPTGATQSLTSLATTSQFVARYSSDGDLAWAFQLGDSPDDVVNAIAVDNAGNVIVGGSFSGTIDFDPGSGATVATSNGGRDAFVASYGADGALRWSRAFGGPGDDGVRGVAAAAGVFYASGSFTGAATVDAGPGMVIASAGGLDGFLASWSGSGSGRWAFSVGGLQDDVATAVSADAAGAIYLGGSFTGTADFGPGAANAPLTTQGGAGGFLARYQSGGTLDWARGLSGVSGVQLFVAGVAAAAGGGVYAAGSFSGTVDFDASASVVTRASVGPLDAFLVSYDATGTFSWVVAAGGTAVTEARGLAVASTGDVVMTGAYAGTSRFDPGSGATLRTAIGSGGATDAFTARYSPAGGLRWAVGFGAPVVGAESSTYGAGVAVDGSGAAITVGQFFGSADADPGVPLAVLTSQGGADGFVVKLTSGGTIAVRP